MTRVVFFQCHDIHNGVATRSFLETTFLSQQLFSCRNRFRLAQTSFLSRPDAFVATSNNISILSSCRNLKILCRDLVSLCSSHSLSRPHSSVTTRVVFFQRRDIQNDVATRSFFQAFSLSLHPVFCHNSFLLALVSLLVVTSILYRDLRSLSNRFAATCLLRS